MGGRGLVLSGGGPVGIAWEAGLIAGLAEAGADIAGADVIVGTSAGSVVGAQLALGSSPADLVEQQLTGDDRRPPSSAGDRGEGSPQLPEELIAAFLGGGEEDPLETRRRVGALALRADPADEDAFLATFGARLADAQWPAGLVCTAVDAEEGTFTAFDGASGVPLLRAVAASCAVPGIFPPITIDGRRYMDGGVRSLTSADLAAGCDEVVVVSLLAAARPGTDPDPLTARQEAELATLREAGATVRLYAPDAEARQQLGPNLMDFSRRAAAAEAGLVQGRAEAARATG